MSNIIIDRFQILGTPVIVYSAWEPCETMLFGHGTQTHINGKWYGKVTSRPLPPEIAKLPRGDERSEAVHSWHAERYSESVEAIMDAYPHLMQPYTASVKMIVVEEGEIEEVFKSVEVAREAAKRC